MRDDLHDIRDGPSSSSGRIIEVTVRVMVGTDRSAVIVSREWDPTLMHEVREHGAEAKWIGAAVEAAVREGVESL